MPDVTNSISLPFYPYAEYSSSFTLRNTSSYLPRSVQFITLLLLHHITQLPKYFRSTSRSVQVLDPYKIVLKMKHFIIFSLDLS
jgi:hypothetical protein